MLGGSDELPYFLLQEGNTEPGQGLVDVDAGLGAYRQAEGTVEFGDGGGGVEGLAGVSMWAGGAGGHRGFSGARCNVIRPYRFSPAGTGVTRSGPSWQVPRPRLSRAS